MALRKFAQRVALLLPAAIVLILTLTACAANDPQSTFGVHGEVARTQLRLFWWIFILAVIVFVLVEGFLLYSLFRFRSRPTDTTLPKQIHGNTKLEIAWTIIPVILLISIAIPTYIVIAKQKDAPVDPNTIKVEVVAHQWWWEFKYPELGIVTANELHLPINTVISWTLHSDDVIHSFWVPKLAGKIDVLPSRVNAGWFKADEVGNYYGQCAEFCGLQHAKMRFRAIATTQADWEKWIAGQKGKPAAAAGLAAQGQALFGAKSCVLCHTITGPDEPGVQEGRMNSFRQQGKGAFAGPNLTFFAERGTFAGGIIDNNTENLHGWLTDPNEIKDGNRMAQLAAVYDKESGVSLSAADVDALVAYLQSRKFSTGQ